MLFQFHIRRCIALRVLRYSVVLLRPTEAMNHKYFFKKSALLQAKLKNIDIYFNLIKYF